MNATFNIFAYSETIGAGSYLAIFAEKSFPIQTNKGFLTVVGAEFEKVNDASKVVKIDSKIIILLH